MITCPSCGAQQSGGPECLSCGIIFARARGKEERSGPVSIRAQQTAELEDAANSALGRFFYNAKGFEIEQHARNWWEILFEWEQRNQYMIRDSRGSHRGAVVEQRKGLVAALVRTFFGSHRPLELAVFDGSEQHIVLTLRRPFFWILSHMQVEDEGGSVIGGIEKRLTFVSKKYRLFDPRGVAFAEIKSGLFRIWTFPVFDLSGRQIAVITKQWGGFLKESWTDADRFTLDYSSESLTLEQRAVIFAAALSIDFDYFENNQKR
jgi:hypothetical protein